MMRLWLVRTRTSESKQMTNNTDEDILDQVPALESNPVTTESSCLPERQPNRRHLHQGAAWATSATERTGEQTTEESLWTEAITKVLE